MNYLTTYHPLVGHGRGRDAIRKYGFARYLDDSCRREPDFESQFPSITSICRGRYFAPRLRESDRIVYMTVKGKYPGYEERHWRLTAVLKVVKRFESHEAAARWYRKRGLILPSNCMVNGNPPLEVDMTANRRRYPSVKWWDSAYRKRVRQNPVFLATESLFLELQEPPLLTEHMLRQVFGRIPVTRTPPRITDDNCQNLLDLAGATHQGCLDQSGR